MGSEDISLGQLIRLGIRVGRICILMLEGARLGGLILVGWMRRTIQANLFGLSPKNQGSQSYNFIQEVITTVRLMEFVAKIDGEKFGVEKMLELLPMLLLTLMVRSPFLAALVLVVLILILGISRIVFRELNQLARGNHDILIGRYKSEKDK